ncbi:hypothetical protein SKAU_G00139740 [Synaphobranchus kaupii]|uniref:C3H1-type domain-containing protein n=1 Tax=Synaphobranchus kaupii TaxID=118154 RepID=A0A9Q1FS68_SYNKA|nr:hypothetical protein SKAU_G00139740 [Synaphobranchus kaupii]
MAFVSLFSSPPNKGLRVADTSASTEREKAGADEADINCEGIRATKKKKKRKKKKNNKWGRNGMINMSTRTGQQEEQEERWQRDSSLQLDQEHRPRVQRTEWDWDYNSEDTISQSVNPRKRKQQSNDHGRPERDFASELDQYRQMREALPPPSPPFPFPPQQTRGLSQEKEMNMRGQENPKETWIHKINRGMPGPGQRGRAQSGRGRRGMSRGRGSRNNNNKPDGRHCGKGRGLSGGKVEALPKEERKKPFLSQDFLDQHTLEVQGRHICKYFLRGACIKGDKCNFEHDTNEPSVTKGDACRFSHEPLTDHTRELLEQFLNSEPVKKEEPDRMEQDDCSSPLPPSPSAPCGQTHC